MPKLNYSLAGTALLAATTPAAAYVGPGLGAGTLGVILGFLGSILLAIFALVWFPMKRMLKRRNEQSEQASAAGVTERKSETDEDQGKV